MIELSKVQKEIIQIKNNPIYVKASAGSGKTRVLTERIRYLLKQTNKKVLALTFTNKAGEEIKERLSDIENLNNRVFIGTFHSFCQSIIENHGNLIGYSKLPHIFELESDRLELIEQAIRETPSYANEYKNLNNKVKQNYKYKVLNFISKVKRELIDENEFKTHTSDENLILLYKNYQDILHNQNAVDFDDLLLLTHKLLLVFPKVAFLYRRSFAGICIDEAQDLNNAQYKFLKILMGDEFKNIMMVGDPNQSIFHFNGSSPKYMENKFVNDYKAKIIELKENYRSSQKIIKAANQLIPEDGKTLEMAKNGIFEIKKLLNEEEEAKWVVNKIINLINLKKHEDIEGEITFEKIAIIARNKYIFNKVKAELENEKIDFYYKMTPGAITFESKIMKLFNLALMVRLNNKDILHKQKLFNSLNINNIEDKELRDVLKEIKDNSTKAIIELIIKIKEDGSNLKKLLTEYKENLIINDDNEKNMIFNDIDELLNHWYNYAVKTENKSLHKFKIAMALGQTHPLSQHKGITLSTVHTMKGQEFDIVFIIGVDNETFPDYRAINEGGVELIQEKNNLYVAFTRAKRFLYVTWPETRMMPWGKRKIRKISKFLTEFDI